MMKVPGSLTGRLFFWWADHPWAQFTLLVLVTVLALIGYRNPSIVRDLFVSAATSDDPEPRRSRRNDTARSAANAANVEPFQIAGGDCVLVVDVMPSAADGDQPADGPDDFFRAAALSAIRDVAAELESMPQVDSVLWLDNVPGLNLFGFAGTLLPSSNASPRQFDNARQTVLDNPLAVGQLISPDGSTILMHLRLDWFYVTSDAAATTEIRERAEQIAGRTSDANLRFQVTGPVPLHLMTSDSHMHNAAKYQAIGYSIMLISALVLFRGLSAVIIVAIAPAVGVFWTMGMLRFFDLQDNPFNDIIVPVLISLVGLTDSVHLMVEIRNQRALGLDTKNAARIGIARVGLACVLTSLTTAIGFVSLSWAHHEIVRNFGWCCVLGVLMTLLSVLTVIPLGCRSPLGRSLHVGLGKSLIDGQLRRIGPIVGWVLRHDRAIAWIAIASTALLAITCLKLQPDEKRYSGMSEAAEAAQALRHLDQKLGGLEFGFVDVQWDDTTSNTELLSVLGAVSKLLGSEPLIGYPLGLHELLESLPGEGSSEERMTLLELLPAELKRAFYSPERNFASTQFRVQDLGIAAYGPTFERVETGIAVLQENHPRFELALTGDAPWRWRNIYRIVNDLAMSLGTASVVIWIVLTVVYRSVRIGLISIIPNLFPLAATGTMLVISGQNLEMVTVCVFTICVGIAVDDTIHFLTRYQEELQHGGDHADVIRRAFTGVGSALLMTTIVLIAGMMSAVVGDARDARLFGIMGSLTLGTALFADVILLPAMLSRFARKPARL
ncbi:efflux RND transporter permease subunit [Neorhodopirellula pilleata]|uniref:Multidrug efflux system subunit MdtC n=1 Tax=Neorhodopirellula pilleata TaxID=2714738 RepID=A0A5C6A7Z7_9BACT|nr:efflux RND transporter permease subunit [Neorhodopirellula pilleata]TWT95649.1 multidrug efflux system subunit MdtC [Neorhodopirellula pilleata]